MIRQKFKRTPMLMSIAFILCSISSMFMLCPNPVLAAVPSDGVTVDPVDVGGYTEYRVFANGNAIIITDKDGNTATNTDTLIYLDANSNGIIDGGENPVALKDSWGNTTDGYDLHFIPVYGGSSTQSVPSTKITMLGGNVETLFGDGLYGVTGSTEVTLSGGTVNKIIYGGSAANTYVTMTGGMVINVFGGAAQSSTGNTHVTISGGTVTNAVLGGGSGNFSVANTEVTITGTASIGGSVYGGGAFAAVTGNASVTMSGGTVGGSVYGGGNGHDTVKDCGAVLGNACVTMSGGTVTGCVYGGGNKLTATTGSTSVTLTGGGVSGDNIFAGGKDGKVLGNTSLTLSGANLSGKYIYGGGENASVEGDTTVTIESGNVSAVCAGGRMGAASVRNSNLIINGGTVSFAYGGGGLGSVSGNTNVTVNGGTIMTFCGGGQEGSVTGSATTILNGGSVKGELYGGGWFSTAVTGSTHVTVSGTATVNNLFGGGYDGSVTNNSTVLMNGGTVTSLLSGGGQIGAVGGTKAVQFAEGVPGRSVENDGTVAQFEVVFYNAKTGTKYSTGVCKPQFVANNAKAVLPSPALVNAGKIIDSWKNDSDDSAYDFASAVTAPLKLYAVWVDAPTYAVIYNGNGSTGGVVPTDSTKYLAGTAVPLPGNTGNLTKTGYTFGGWSTSATGTAITSYTMGTAPATFYAVWTAAPANNPTNNDNTTNSSGTTTTSVAPSLETGSGQTIAGTLEAAATGSTVEVNMNDSTMLQGDWLKAIAGRDVNLVLDMGNGIKWTINGKSIAGTNFSNVNLGISNNANAIPASVLNSVSHGRKTVPLTISHNGNLGFTATLSASFGKEYAGQLANVFYYNEDTKKLEFQGAYEIGADGSAALAFKHFSSYAVVIDKASLATELSAGASAEDTVASNILNKQWGFAALVIVLSSAAVLILFAIQKHRAK